MNRRRVPSTKVLGYCRGSLRDKQRVDRSAGIAFLLLLGLSSALGRAQAADPGSPKDPGEVIDRIPLAKLEPDIVLQSGDIKISLVRVLKVETAYVAATKRKFPRASINPDQYSRLRKHFAFQFLVNALIERYAAERKLTVPPEFIEKSFAKLKALKAQSGGSYEQHLADNGLSDEEYRRFWTAKWAIEKDIGETQLKEQEIDARIQELLASEHLPLRRVSHILYSYRGAKSAEADVLRSRQDAREAALVAIARLKGGEKFDALARASSDCPSRQRGGDLDFVPRKDMLMEELGSAAYALQKPGDYSPEPVETPLGYHVLKLDALRTPEEARALVQKEYPRQRVKDMLVLEKFDKLMQQLVEQAAAAAQFSEKLVPDPEPERQPKKP